MSELQMFVMAWNVYVYWFDLADVYGALSIGAWLGMSLVWAFGKT